MLFLFLTQQPLVVLRQVYFLEINIFTFSLYVFLSGIPHCMTYYLKTMQSIDMIVSLYENNFPVRFGVVLYSSKYVMQLEDHSAKEDVDKFEEDISDKVIYSFSGLGIYTNTFFRWVYRQDCETLFLLFHFSDYTSLQLYQGELWYSNGFRVFEQCMKCSSLLAIFCPRCFYSLVLLLLFGLEKKKIIHKINMIEIQKNTYWEKTDRSTYMLHTCIIPSTLKVPILVQLLNLLSFLFWLNHKLPLLWFTLFFRVLANNCTIFLDNHSLINSRVYYKRSLEPSLQKDSQPPKWFHPYPVNRENKKKPNFFLYHVHPVLSVRFQFNSFFCYMVKKDMTVSWISFLSTHINIVLSHLKRYTRYVG